MKNHDFTQKNPIVSNCGGRRENVWGISCEKSRFYAKKPYFSNFRGGEHRVCPPPLPGSAPAIYFLKNKIIGFIFGLLIINDISRETHTKWYYITVRFSSHMAKLSTPSLWAGIELPTVGVIGTYIGTCISYYHAISAMMASIYYFNIGQCYYNDYGICIITIPNLEIKVIYTTKIIKCSRSKEYHLIACYGPRLLLWYKLY